MRLSSVEHTRWPRNKGAGELILCDLCDLFYLGETTA